MALIDTDRNIYAFELTNKYSRFLFVGLVILYLILSIGSYFIRGETKPTSTWYIGTIVIITLISWWWTMRVESNLIKKFLVSYPHCDARMPGWAIDTLKQMSRIFPWTFAILLLFGILQLLGNGIFALALLTYFGAFSSCYMILRRRFIIRITCAFLSQGDDHGKKYRGSRIY